MSLGKRISALREERARARAKRREERRRADRAKEGATPADRARARAERRKAQTAEATETKPSAKATPESKPKPKPEAGRKSKPAPAEPKPLAKRKRAGAREAPAPARALAGGAGKTATQIRAVVAEVLKLGREMLAIPLQLWLAAAEIAGAVVLRAWLRVVRPVLMWLWRLGRAVLTFAQRHVTPAHGVLAVGFVAIGALAASQWLDYHSVSVGTDAYSGTVGTVAPAPEVETEIAGEAHSWVMLPLAAAALVVLTLALSGRRRLAALLIPIGLAAIAIALIVDLPKGLDEGSASLAYEGASAHLLEGFWMQIAAGAVLVVCGLLLPRYLRPVPAGDARAARPSGPTLFQQAAAAIRKRRGRRPVLRRPARPRPKRKVQGAGT